MKGNPDYQLLYTIPGIGPINALTILAEAGDLRHFQHHRQFLKFCGMDLHNQSGMFRGQTKLSKYGNARLRRTLWMAAQVAILQRANSFRDKFERYITKDATTPIYAARRLQQSPQRWPGPCMRLLKAVNPIAPSLRKIHSGRTLLLQGRGGAGPFSDLVDNVQAFRSTAKGSRLKDGESRDYAYSVFVRGETVR